MIQAVQHSTILVDTLRFTPAGLSLPVPAHRARSCSTRSPCYVSRAIERAALGTETDSPGHSRNIRANLPEVRL
jgi:hypothetical protein